MQKTISLQVSSLPNFHFINEFLSSMSSYQYILIVILVIAVFFIVSFQFSNVDWIRRSIGFQNDIDIDNIGLQSKYIELNRIIFHSSIFTLLSFILILFDLTLECYDPYKIDEVGFIWAILNSSHIGFAFFLSSFNSKNFRYKILKPFISVGVNNIGISEDRIEEIKSLYKNETMNPKKFAAGIFLGIPVVLAVIFNSGINTENKLYAFFDLTLVIILVLLTYVYISSFIKRFVIVYRFIDYIKEIKNDENRIKTIIKIRTYLGGSSLFLGIAFSTGILSSYYYLDFKGVENEKIVGYLGFITVIYAMYMTILFIIIRVRLSDSAYSFVNKKIKYSKLYTPNVKVEYFKNREDLLKVLGNGFNWIDLIKLMIAIVAPLITIILTKYFGF